MTAPALMLLSMMAATWPAGSLTGDEVRRIDGGELVSKRWIDEGVMYGRLGGRIEQNASWVAAELRRDCFTVKVPQMIDARLFDAKTVESGGPDASLASFTRDRIEELKPASCAAVQNAARFYGYAVYDSPGFFPDAWSLVRYEVERGPHGALVVTTDQVAGSTKSSHSTISLHPISPARSVLTATVTFELGIPMPDALLRVMVDVDEQAPRAGQLRALRQRARDAR